MLPSPRTYGELCAIAALALPPPTSTPEKLNGPLAVLGSLRNAPWRPTTAAQDRAILEAAARVLPHVYGKESAS